MIMQAYALSHGPKLVTCWSSSLFKLDEPGVTVYVLVVEHHQTDSYNLRRVMNVSAAWSYAFY